MKKILFTIAAMACLSGALTSCDERLDEPKAQAPTDKNFLNTPPTANFTYDLASTPTVTFTVSQPNYQVGTSPTYVVEIALKPDFDGCPTEYLYTGADATEDPAPYYVIPSETTNATIEVLGRDLADGINAIRGYNKLEQVQSPDFVNYEGPLYVRVRSYFPGASAELMDLYTITSNVITLSHVIGFATVRVPGYIYLIGQPGGWTGPEAGNATALENWKLFEADEAIGSQVYYGTFDIAAGQFMFRFYSALEGWDYNSIGAQDEDSPVDVAMKDGVYSGPCYFGPEKGEGKGAWNIPGWEGGQVAITVNLKAKTVEFKKVN